jgi:diguanylate cyclase (GGDEF)-like protein/PAS domain S-box-containing protein
MFALFSNDSPDAQTTARLSQEIVLQALVENAYDSIYFKDLNGRFSFVNQNKARRHGEAHAADMIGKSDADYLQSDVAQALYQAERIIMQSGKPVVGVTEKLIRTDGSVYWTSASKYPLLDLHGQVIGLWGISRDITEEIIAKEALLRSEARFKALVENVSDVIEIIGSDNKTTYVSPNIRKFFGWTPEEMINQESQDFIHPDDRERTLYEFNKLIEQDEASVSVECQILHKDGHYSPIEVTAVNLIHHEHIQGVLLNYHDISERKQKEREILYLNYHDVLTGLYNRAFYQEERLRLDTPRQLPISLIMGDVNGLKLTNDAFGHVEGDKLLTVVAGILRQCCRKEDIIARIGGDEFCILLPQTDSGAACLICERIYQACAEYDCGSGPRTFHPSISLGHATKVSEKDALDDVFKEAEARMYRRKLQEHKSMHSAIINSIQATLNEKSHDTEDHSLRMSELSRKLGQALDLSDNELIELDLLAALHDIGKISIEDRILQKSGTLTEEEWASIRKHPLVGYRIAQASTELARIAKYILSHHERWDGRGYPHGLSGEDIPLLSRVIAVIDAYDAMTQDRPYRRALSQGEAIREIITHAGDQFDPQVARVFVEKVLHQ